MNKLSGKMLGIIGVMAALSGIDDNSNDLKPDKINVTKKDPPRSKSLKYFPEYGVWAINEKNAKRKRIH